MTSQYDHRNRDQPFNETESVTIDSGQEGSVTFTLTGSRSRFFLPTLAISKKGGTTYELELDGQTVYGPAGIPPTDVDDDSDTFRPPEYFERKATVTITNTSANDGRTYFVQLVGWERPTDGGY